MQQIEVIKVAAAKVERTSHNPNTRAIGKKFFVSKTYETPSGKKTLGSQGCMTISDWEMKNYLPYGLKPNDIRLNKAATESLETENAKLLAELEALKAKLAGASVTEDAPEEYTTEPAPAPRRSRRKGATEEGGEA
jgi:hypothetical protein